MKPEFMRCLRAFPSMLLHFWILTFSMSKKFAVKITPFASIKFFWNGKLEIPNLTSILKKRVRKTPISGRKSIIFNTRILVAWERVPLNWNSKDKVKWRGNENNLISSCFIHTLKLCVQSHWYCVKKMCKSIKALAKVSWHEKFFVPKINKISQMSPLEKSHASWEHFKVMRKKFPHKSIYGELSERLRAISKLTI